MKNKIIVRKLIQGLKIGSFILLITLSVKANAEYYLVIGGCSTCHEPVNPCSRCHPARDFYVSDTCIVSHAPFRNRHYSGGGSGQMEEYEWVGDP